MKRRGSRDGGKADATPDDADATRSDAKATKVRRDWLGLEREFVTGTTDDLAAFCRERGLNRPLAAAKAAAEGWREKRAAHVGRVHKGATERIAKQQIASESEIDGLAHRLAMRLVTKLDAMLDDIETPGDAKALAQALSETWGTARKTAHLPGEPTTSDPRTGPDIDARAELARRLARLAPAPAAAGDDREPDAG